MPQIHGLGRIRQEDPRDQSYLLRATPLLAALPARPKRKTWYLPERLNQGSRPHCVGFAWKGFLLSRPRRRTASDPVTIYNEAQRLDGIPGEDYDGTTVRGGAVFLKKEARLVGSYRWAFTLRDALDACGLVGPLVLGTDWLEGMMSPTASNVWTIQATGSFVGGHAYLLLGYDDSRGLALIHNSWGSRWGLDGRAYIPYFDLDRLIRHGGEACIALET